MKTRAYVIILVVGLMMLATPAWGRVWQERNGRTYEGEFSGLINGFVEIDANGRIIRVRLEDLSDADQQYVRDMTSSPPSNSGGGGNNAAPPTTDNTGGGNGGANTGGAPVSQPGGAGSSMPNLGDRNWTDDRNRSVNGRFGGLIDQTTVRIIQNNGTPLDVPIGNLSQSDQDYVNEVVRLFDPRVHGRIWTRSDNTTFQGTFVQIKRRQVWVLTSFNDDRLEIEGVDLSLDDRAWVAGTLDQRVTRPPALDSEKFRVWTAGDGTWSVIGRLKSFQNNEVTLEQEDEDITITLGDLASADQDYVRERFPAEEESLEDQTPMFEDDRSDSGWAKYYNWHPVFYVIFIVSVLGLVCAIAWKYIAESFQTDDDD